MASPPEALAHAQLEWDTPLYRMAVAQFDQAVTVGVERRQVAIDRAGHGDVARRRVAAKPADRFVAIEVPAPVRASLLKGSRV